MKDENRRSHLSENLSNALHFMEQTRETARVLGKACSEFAIEIQDLLSLGLSHFELRTLVHLGLVRHVVEVPSGDSDIRRFTNRACTSFCERSCFLVCGGDEGNDAADRIESSTMNCRPRWNSIRRELQVGYTVVKRFRTKAANQERVLMAFEEEGWPPRIDDPLSPSPNVQAKRRLHDTIKCLNRGQQFKLIWFRGDGTGEGILWELRLSPQSLAPSLALADIAKRSPNTPTVRNDDGSGTATAFAT